MKKILFIVTGHHQLGERGHTTGLYLSEFADPYKQFTQAGYDLEIASPTGGNAPVDPKSLAEDLAPFIEYVRDTIAIADVEPEDYDAYFIVGGHGALWDLPHNRDLQHLLSRAYTQGKIIAAVDHGTAALVPLHNQHTSFPVQGRWVTGTSNHEESARGLADLIPFSPEESLKHAGAHYSCKPIWQPHIVIDQQLVTGQNPASAHSVGHAVINLLSRLEAPA